MKKVILALGALLISMSAFASDVLDGKSYCRTLISDGLFGQPKGERHHCLSFAEGFVTDNANTFFGNPPEHFRYIVNGRILTFGDSKYVISKDLSDLVTVLGSAVEGTVLDLK